MPVLKSILKKPAGPVIAKVVQKQKGKNNGLDSEDRVGNLVESNACESNYIAIMIACGVYSRQRSFASDFDRSWFCLLAMFALSSDWIVLRSLRLRF
eukprot:322813-Alexandrium_andersonii.AAC.1